MKGLWRFKAGLYLSVICSTFGSMEGSIVETLASIEARALATKSSALLIGQQGRIVASYGNCQQLKPLDTWSITKSFVSLAIGLLMQEGSIESIDTPVHYFFPEWNQGYKKAVTIRHLLSHTSGMMDSGYGCAEISEFPDALQMALATDFTTPPGTAFVYNNKAVNLLAGVVERAAKTSLHNYLKSRLFVPLGISTDNWLCDQAGNNYGMAHLSLSANDLIKVGMLIGYQGNWYGRRLLSEQWLTFMKDASQSFTPFYGPLWWLGYESLAFYWDDVIIEKYCAAGLSQEYIKALKELQGRVLHMDCYTTYGNYLETLAPQLAPYFGDEVNVGTFFETLQAKGLPIARWQTGPVKSIAARGCFGQQLIIFPIENVVAVRLSELCANNDALSDNFSELDSWVNQLAYDMYLYPTTNSYK